MFNFFVPALIFLPSNCPTPGQTSIPPSFFCVVVIIFFLSLFFRLSFAGFAGLYKGAKLHLFWCRGGRGRLPVPYEPYEVPKFWASFAWFSMLFVWESSFRFSNHWTHRCLPAIHKSHHHLLQQPDPYFVLKGHPTLFQWLWGRSNASLTTPPVNETHKPFQWHITYSVSPIKKPGLVDIPTCTHFGILTFSR